MNAADSNPDVDHYIAGFPDDVRALLEEIRAVIRSAAPDAEERIAYGMPAYRLNGKVLIYFAGYPRHIGLYATPTGHDAFRTELAGYKQGKGSVQFPLNQPMPYDLIRRIVEWRVGEVRSNPAASGSSTSTRS